MTIIFSAKSFFSLSSPGVSFFQAFAKLFHREVWELRAYLVVKFVFHKLALKWFFPLSENLLPLI